MNWQNAVKSKTFRVSAHRNEPPDSPDLIVQTQKKTVDETVDLIIELLREKNIIR